MIASSCPRSIGWSLRSWSTVWDYEVTDCEVYEMADKFGSILKTQTGTLQWRIAFALQLITAGMSVLGV